MVMSLTTWQPTAGRNIYATSGNALNFKYTSRSAPKKINGG